MRLRAGVIVKRPVLPTLMALLLAGGSTAQPSAIAVDGIWSNPKGSVYVRTERCGDRLCGEVVCATPNAIAKAGGKGAGSLVGTKLFDDLHRRDDGSWRGKIFVPDRGGRFPSTLKAVGADRIEVRGCAVAGLICKSQIWNRVDAGACERLAQSS